MPSFDRRGFGQSGGTVTVMDPDRDGASLVSLVDRAKVNLDWLQFRDGNLLLDGLANNRFSDAEQQALIYRGNRYFCDGISFPGKRAAATPPPVDALFFQGMHDVLFSLNEGLANYECLSASGGDVRLLGYNLGHVLPSGTDIISGGVSGPTDFTRCGPYHADELSLAWFNAKLKLDPTAQATIAAAPEHCVVLESTGEGVVLDQIPYGGTNYDIPLTMVPELLDVPMSVPRFTATQTTVVAGIPIATLSLANPNPVSGLPGGLPLGIDTSDAITFVSLAVSRAGALPSALEIIDDQVRPVRGFGTQTLELNGIGIKLNPGDRLDLLLAGQSLPQFPLITAHNPLLPTINVSGSVQVTVLGNVPTVD